jgi:surface protein
LPNTGTRYNVTFGHEFLVSGAASSAVAKFGQIEQWDTSQVTLMDHLFKDKISFNSDISSWNTSRVTSMNQMFCGAHMFSQNVASWYAPFSC